MMYTMVWHGRDDYESWDALFESYPSIEAVMKILKDWKLDEELTIKDLNTLTTAGADQVELKTGYLEIYAVPLRDSKTGKFKISPVYQDFGLTS